MRQSVALLKRVEAEEFRDFRQVIDPGGTSLLPIHHRHLIAADDLGHVDLAKVEVEPAFTDFLARGLWSGWVALLLRRIRSPWAMNLRSVTLQKGNESVSLRLPDAGPGFVGKSRMKKDDQTAADAGTQAGGDSFSSSHTSNFPALVRELGISLVVSTYQAGKLILVRAQGDELNTHFRDFLSPMGVAYQPDRGRLAIGAKHEVWEFQNQREVAAKLEPPSQCDAVFLPRNTHYSGDIRIHEIGYIGRELWAVNTRFSCLCTFDADNSFVPRWRPKFITALSPEDRCHLNGMAIAGGKVKLATCLGATDTSGGWRDNKRDGGLLLDVDSGELLVRGLSMPHSPRVYGNQVWLLESGHGTISTADLKTGKTEMVAKLPGFTRGLDFHGPFAFIGLSQVRESAVFSGIPLVEEMSEGERTCGVYVVDIRSGEVVAFLRFEGIVQEIFAVTVLPGIAFPDLINEPGETLDSSFVLPDEALGDVPQELRVS